MSKILNVNVQNTTIGLDNGEILEIDTAKLNFIPNVNDEVEVFKSQEKTIVRKIEKLNNLYSNGKPVNKWTYVLLTFFLGGIEFHKFYVGKTRSGILYLLFCWTFIPAIVAFVEFIIGITKTPDENGNIFI